MPTAAEIKAMITRVKPIEEVKREAPVPIKVRKPRKKKEDNTELQEALAIIAKQPIKRINRKDFGGNGHWSFPDQMASQSKFGFIYVIRDLRNGMSYIGKKQYRGRGDENFGIESNWPWYASSRDSLVEQIKIHGKEWFEFIVLEEYCSNKALGYAETWSLMRAETTTNQDKWYNRLVNKVNWFCKEPISQRHKDRLDAIIKGDPLTIIVTE